MIHSNSGSTRDGSIVIIFSDLCSDAGKKSEILKSSGANFLKLKPAEGTEATETTTSEIEWPDPEKIVEKPEFESLAKELETEAKSLLDNTVSAQALAALNRMRI